MISSDRKPELTTAAGDDSSLRGVTASRAQTYDQFSAIIDEKLANGLLTSIKRKLLSDSDILQFREPLLIRMRAGLLSEESLQSFITHAAQGGLSLKAFRENPLLPLDQKLTSSLVPGEWLPPYLKERVAAPADFGIQQQRIIDAMQGIMKAQSFSLPLFFLGSSAVPRDNIASDIDIGTSCALRNENMKAFDTATEAMRRAMASNPLILGNKNHIGAVFDQMVLALGVSVARYGRALRVTPDIVYAIEPNDQAG